MAFLLGKKIGLTQIFRNDEVVPVTILQAGPCYVLQIKNKEKDGYEAIQIGYQKITKAKRITKAMKGKEYRFIKEFKPQGVEYKVGDEIKVDIFKTDQKINISGITKGHGFTGVVARHGFHGHNTTHGTKDQERMPGSIGSTAAQRVLKGRRMAGRMGAERATIKNLQIIEIQPDKNLLLVKGAVPGANHGLIEIKA
ncbi:MAG: 50S ribosomal protein L3 [Patescibacteria group bacterium]|nr:50S ribosomal protein L3 [Patescibacteria group bacterium]MDD5121055.1 50S ribosomal protein L3 [Patescibacteria group bacterium]MDD5221583.1 50S ribosomal protein L3 [Patescibacteria group bacterium]MDD5396026.1 50S ribosomal protein L3 [Patescibacteria group bacterium]